MKVGILTYHRAINPGSVVQAYCLQKLLRRLLPQAQVEVVDYRPRSVEIRKFCKRFLSKRPPFVNNRPYMKKVRNMRRFISEYLVLSSNRLITDSAARSEKWLARQGYDVVIVGSDTIWEIRRGAYSPKGVNAFHLPGTTPFKRIAFAASMDPIPLHPAESEEELRLIIQHVRKFDFLSVRDDPTRRFLVERGIEEGTIEFMPDPTLLVDFDELVEQPPWKKDKRPVAGVALPFEAAREAHSSLKAHGYEVWDWNGISSENCDRVLNTGYSVGQVLGLHRELDLMITDRFHGSIFTMRLAGAPVLFVEHADKWPLPVSKGRDLFCRLGIEKAVIRWPAENIDVDILHAKLALVEERFSDFKRPLRTIREVAERGPLKYLVDVITV